MDSPKSWIGSWTLFFTSWAWTFPSCILWNWAWMSTY